IAGIDSNGNGAFSEGEERAYVQRVLSDLSITIDGRSVQPVLLTFSFPEPAQMREGMGEIHIEYSVKSNALESKTERQNGDQDRSLIVTNHHLNQTSVYLMNALVPQDPGIRILAQKRNE